MAREVPALPCCLAQSPCPHGWGARWKMLAGMFELWDSAGEELPYSVALLGDALQALAATPTVKKLLSEGNTGQATTVLQQFLSGYLAAHPAASRR